ncbi:MAG: purine-nucleoside phosphorylase [Gemmatimonadota bacterium]
MAAAVREAAGTVRERLRGREPRVAITMGSGLGGLAGAIEDALEIPYAALPGWPRPTVEGHAGRLVTGTLGGVAVLGLSGRVHLYEGGDPARTGFYVRVLGELGVPILFLSNAAGAIRPGWEPGDLMLIADHLNLQFRSPLVGPRVEGETRFPDMTAAYDGRLRAGVREAARELGIELHEGVYAALPGPSYETPAEIRMLERLGADAVGMSTVPEVLVARARGIRCVGVSCLTNYAAGVRPEPLVHEEVMETARLVQADFQRLVASAVARFEP